MEDHNEPGADSKAITRNSPDAKPVTIITNAEIIKDNSRPLIRRRWFQITIVVAAISFIGIIVEIPNSIMNWFINVRTLTKPDASTITTASAFWQPPELPEDCQLVYGSYGHFQGYESVSALKKKQGSRLNLFYGIGPCEFYIQSNRFYVSLSVPTFPGEIKIRGDQISRNTIPSSWDMNSSSNALEIVDGKGKPILQLYYRKPNEIVVLGLVAATNHIWSVDYDHSIMNPPAASPPNLQQMFKYPSFNRHGQFDNNWMPPPTLNYLEAEAHKWSLILGKPVSITPSNMVVDGKTIPIPSREEVAEKLRLALPRSIGQEVKSKMVEILSKAPKGKVLLSAIESDLEAVSFLRDIENTLTNAGFPVEVGLASMVDGIDTPLVGLQFAVKQKPPPPHADAILQAFASLVAVPFSGTNMFIESGTLQILVGPKPTR